MRLKSMEENHFCPKSMGLPTEKEIEKKGSNIEAQISLRKSEWGCPVNCFSTSKKIQKKCK